MPIFTVVQEAILVEQYDAGRRFVKRAVVCCCSGVRDALASLIQHPASTTGWLKSRRCKHG